MNDKKKETIEEKKDGLRLLKEPFPKDQINYLPKPTCPLVEWKELPKGKCATCGAYHATTKTLHLAFVGHAALTARLLDADPEWTWVPMGTSPDGSPYIDKEGGLWIWLTVCGVTRPGYGDAGDKTGGNAMKERIGDAIRNAAMRFGAALDLWHKGETSLFDDSDPEPESKDKSKAEPRKTSKPEGTMTVKQHLAAEVKKKDLTKVEENEFREYIMERKLAPTYVLQNLSKIMNDWWVAREDPLEGIPNSDEIFDDPDLLYDSDGSRMR